MAWLGFGSRGGGVVGFPQNSAGAWIIPSEGGPVVCHEVLKSVFEEAATTLGIATNVQALSWHEATLGKDRLFIPQSLATSAEGGIAKCELGSDPLPSVNFDDARTYCAAMGTGWGLLNQAQSFIIAVISQAYWASQSKANPTGNTQHGRSDQVTAEVGIRSDGLAVTGSSQGTYARTLTGQRALADGGGELLAWSHNGTPGGIFDMVGNVWKWTSRFRIVGWEIQVIPASAGLYPDHGVASSAWRAILADGSLVAPGTANTLKYSTDSGIYLSATQAGSGATAFFRSIGAGSISPVPPLLIALGLFPWSSSVPTIGRMYMSFTGERLPIRGGSGEFGVNEGVASCILNNARTVVDVNLGFRPSYVY